MKSLEYAPQPVAQQSVKGIALRAGMQWVSRTYGMSAVQSIYDAGSPGLRAAIVPGLSSFGIVSSSWYDIEVVAELIDLIDTVTRPGDLEAHWSSIADAIATDNLSGVYRSLFRLISSRELFVAHSQRVWSAYFSAGGLAVTSPRAGELVLEVSGVRHYEPVCRTSAAIIEKLLGKLGFIGASLERVRCVSSGAPLCVYEVDYLA